MKIQILIISILIFTVKGVLPTIEELLSNKGPISRESLDQYLISTFAFAGLHEYLFKAVDKNQDGFENLEEFTEVFPPLVPFLLPIVNPMSQEATKLCFISDDYPKKDG